MRRVKYRLLLLPALLALIVLTTFWSERAPQPQQWGEVSKDYVRALVRRPRKPKVSAEQEVRAPGACLSESDGERTRRDGAGRRRLAKLRQHCQNQVFPAGVVSVGVRLWTGHCYRAGRGRRVTPEI
jgi:hypothetical protein